MTEQEPTRYWHPAATTLRRVVPVAQKRKVSGLTIALSFLEIHEEGNGYLRFLMCQDRPRRWRALTTPRLEVRILDGSGRLLETREDGSGSSMQSSYATLESDASLLVFGLPESGYIDVEILRVVNLKMDSPLLHYRMRLESILRRQEESSGYLREEGRLSRLFQRIIGEEGPIWDGPWTFRFRV